MLANALLGNALGAAVVEMFAIGSALRAERAISIALSGAQAEVTVDGQALTIGQPHTLYPGQRLSVGRFARGRCVYLALAGGVAVEPVLGSRSTDLAQGFGGFAGRWLEPGDVIRGFSATLRRTVPWWCELPLPTRELSVRFLPTGAAQPTLDARRFRVSANANRMAVPLDGDPLPPLAPLDASIPVLPGAIQLPPDGRPIVLGVDAQLTGGYPLLGWVISADLRLLAQAPAGTLLRFVAVEREAAAALARRARGAFNAALTAINERLDA
jgi:5-oxoprolinase (ATP-hydrolysing) subunit C